MISYYIDAVSTYAQDIDNLITFIAVVVGIWLLLAEGVLFALIFRFRHKPGGKALYVTGELKHEKRWVTIPHLLVLVCDIFIIVAAIRVWVDIKQVLPEPESVIRVTGQQWTWTFQHPGLDNQLDTDDDIITTDELHIEVGRTYHFKLGSLDVLHSFSIPAFRLKQDAVPGREITGWFKATATGEYSIPCAEICGIGHGLMVGRLFIETPEEHAAWLYKQAPGAAYVKR